MSVFMKNLLLGVGVYMAFWMVFVALFLVVMFL